MNPGAGGLVSALTAGFKPDPLMKTLPVVGGVLGNAMLSGFVSKSMPDVLKTGAGNLALGLGTAGLLGAVSAMVFSPAYAQGVFLGGVIEVVTRGVRQYLLPKTMTGMGDYLTRQNAAEARPLGDYAEDMLTNSYLPSYSHVTGLNETGVLSYAQATDLNPSEYGMGDYLTPQNAAMARPLGALMANDIPVERTIQDELSFAS